MSTPSRPLDRHPGLVESGVSTMARVAIIGGGIIGLSCAWRLLRAGCRVTVLDPAVAAGATHGAGGMITPASEAVFGQEALLAASLESSARWPDFAAELEQDSGLRIDLVRSGTLFVAATHDDEAVLARQARLLERHHHTVERLPSRAARRLEPALSPRLAGALLIDDESCVDPRQVARALVAAITAAGGVIRTVEGRPAVSDHRIVGVETAADLIPADLAVLAAGWQTPKLSTPLGVEAPIRPVKGQVLRLRTAAPNALGRIVRAVVHGRFVYLVPRPGDEVVVGATMEDVGPDSTVTAGAVHDLLHDAIEVVPELAEAALVESIARMRPSTPDNLPLVGPIGTGGLLMAAGHGRDGVLLAPLTADIVTAQVLGTPLPDHADTFAPQRFPQLERP